MTVAPDTNIEKINKENDRKICGIVMPISHMSDEYSSAHWARVRSILETAILKVEFTPRVVWDNPETPVIQSKILKNIYENDVVICDLSNLNPNVMLEAGLRLSTKKPTIIVTDAEKKPPFDIATVEYISYPRNLEYNSICSFINELSERIISEYKAYNSGNYKSFVENYQFEIAKPSTIEISGEQYIQSLLKEIKLLILSVTSQKNQKDKYKVSNKINFDSIYKFTFHGSEKEFKKLIIENFSGPNLFSFIIGGFDENNLLFGEIIINEGVNLTEKINIIKFLRTNNVALERAE